MAFDFSNCACAKERDQSIFTYALIAGRSWWAWKFFFTWCEREKKCPALPYILKGRRKPEKNNRGRGKEKIKGSGKGNENFYTCFNDRWLSDIYKLPHLWNLCVFQKEVIQYLYLWVLLKPGGPQLFNTSPDPW